MKGFIVELGLCSCHEIPDPGFHIFSIVMVKIIHFHGCDFPVESIENWHSHCFFTFCPEIQVTKGKHPTSRSSLSKIVEIRSRTDEQHGEISCPKHKGLTSGHSEVFVVP